MEKTGDKKFRRYMMIQRVNMESQRGNAACITSGMSLKSISGPFTYLTLSTVPLIQKIKSVVPPTNYF